MTSRALRLGVVLGDALVEEKIVTGPVTFGQSLRCTLSVPADGVPHEHVLFTRDDRRFVVHPLPGMDVVERGTRGKLRLGEVTVLFQEIAAPVPQPRPRLPPSVRGTLADRIDRRLAIVVGSSLIVHVAIAAWAWSGDVDTGYLAEPRVAQTYHPDTIDVWLPDPVVDTTPHAPGAAIPAPPHPIAPIPSSERHRQEGARIANAIPPSHDDAVRMAAILTSNDASHGPGEMSHRQPGADLAQQIEDARTRRVTIGDDGHTSRVDDRARLGTDSGPGIDPLQPTFELPAHHAEHDDRGRVTLGALHPEEPTSLTPDSVLQKIGTLYLPGLQRCYRIGLRDNATLGGRVELGFTVSETGKVTDASASGVTSAVDACIEAQMSSWRFAIPRDKSGQPTDTALHLVLALQPS